MPSPYLKEKRRTVELGYPKEFVFSNVEELNNYLNSEKITCLLCGKKFKSLGHHIMGIHQMSVDDYKEKYGIPFTRGLTSESTTLKHTINAKKKVEQGVLRSTAENREKAHQAILSGSMRKRVPIRDIYSNDNLKIINKDCTTKTRDKIASQTKFGSDEYYEKMKNRPSLYTEERIALLRKIAKYKKPRKPKPQEVI